MAVEARWPPAFRFRTGGWYGPACLVVSASGWRLGRRTPLRWRWRSRPAGLKRFGFGLAAGARDPAAVALAVEARGGLAHVGFRLAAGGLGSRRAGGGGRGPLVCRLSALGWRLGPSTAPRRRASSCYSGQSPPCSGSWPSLPSGTRLWLPRPPLGSGVAESSYYSYGARRQSGGPPCVGGMGAGCEGPRVRSSLGACELGLLDAGERRAGGPPSPFGLGESSKTHRPLRYRSPRPSPQAVR